ncbi:MAG: 4'-phosphopantetheinyl transferase superfamily protein [Clostridia bacterium]|nr:4'-phosphopantetheinyl transferase superfamily protein [Clostridia bacterium]
MKTVAVYTDYSSVSEYTGEILKSLIAAHIEESSEKLRNDSVCVRALLRFVLKKHFGVTAFVISADENGKPYLKGSNLHINFSHSDGKALCVVSTEPVGCDVQSFKPFNPKVSERYYREEESGALLKSKSRDYDFIKLWVLKESILKQRGTGLSGGLNSYGFSKYLGADCFDAYGLKFRCFDDESFCYAICSETDDITVYEINIEETIKI